MTMKLAARADFTRATYLPFETSAPNRNPRSLAEIAEVKDQATLSGQINTNLERYQDIMSALSKLDQTSSDLNKNPGEVAVSGAKVPGYGLTFDAYFKFEPSPTGKEQPVVAAELAEDGETVFTYRQETQGAETRLTATVFDRITGQEYQLAGPLNGVSEVTTNPKKSRVFDPRGDLRGDLGGGQSVDLGGDWYSGSWGTTPP